VFTDASDFACGGVVIDTKREFFHVMLDDFDRAKSSTYRELKAVELLLRTFGESLKTLF
jgi:hypothetical protein